MTLALGLLLTASVGLQGVDSHAHHLPPADSAAGGADSAAIAEVVVGSGPLRGATLEVGPGGFASISEAVAASEPGDTLAIAPGVYEERITVTHPLTLLGRGGAILDGGGEGTIVTVRGAPHTRIRGLTIRSSGKNVSREDAGIMVERSPGFLVEECRLEDVLFGVYLKESRASTVRDNVIVGKGLPVANRGDGIRFWYSPAGTIAGNDVLRARDVVIWFSDSLLVRSNRIEDGRYGLHYMYSDHNRFEDNRFSGNLVGAFLMYSTDLTFNGNVFARSTGASGMGLGLKDSENVVATGNVFVRNAVGIYLDNSPLSGGKGRNLFQGNVVALNEVGVSLLPSVADNHMVENAFLQNLREVAVSGGGDALANRWEGNRWSSYAGFDADGDGAGDTPFVLTRLSDQLLTTHPELEVFTLSLAAEGLDLLARVLPFLEPAPVVVDSAPRIGASMARVGNGNAKPVVRDASWVGLAVLGVLAVALRAAVRFRRLTFPYTPSGRAIGGAA